MLKHKDILYERFDEIIILSRNLNLIFSQHHRIWLAFFAQKKYVLNLFI
jgi:hypothetical protein